MLEVSIKVPGSCGELIQGMLNQVNFLVTCPIDCYSVVTIKKSDCLGITVDVPEKNKLITAVKQAIKIMEIDPDQGYEIVVSSDLTVGKGMASSTADMTAAILGVALINGKQADETLISRILLDIEPSDGIFYNGIVAFDHIHGSFCEKVGDSFPANFLIYDYGGEIDTIAFNANPLLQSINLEKQPVIKKAYELLKTAFDHKDIRTLGQAVTISAIENQKLLYKKDLEDIILLSSDCGAYGINVAHSGTLIGIVNNEATDLTRLQEKMHLFYPELTCLGNFSLVNGGYEYVIKGES